MTEMFYNCGGYFITEVLMAESLTPGCLECFSFSLPTNESILSSSLPQAKDCSIFFFLVFVQLFTSPDLQRTRTILIYGIPST